MKLSARDANAYFNKPNPDAAGLLICGEDTMRVAMKRQEVVAKLVGPNGEEEMRLTRMSGADLRKDAAALLDAVKAQGFFPGVQGLAHTGLCSAPPPFGDPGDPAPFPQMKAWLAA